MILKIGSGEGQQTWHLHFHTTLAETDEERAAKTPPQPPLRWDIETICFVHTGPCVLTFKEPKYCINGQPGVAKTSKKDQHLKSQGAKLALARALSKMPGVPKATRKAIWDAYWSRVRRPKEKPDKFRKRRGIVGQAAQRAAAEVLGYLGTHRELSRTYSGAEADEMMRPVLAKVAQIIDRQLYRN